MKKKTFFTILTTAFTIFTLGAVFTGTMAWFASTISISSINGSGSTMGAYFAYGDGKPLEYDQETGEIIHQPYGISEIRHLNNLAWLQYNGTFDDDHYCFELANDINIGQDSSEFVMPPIGTETHPFIGVFDGNGYTINNIKVTNDANEFTHKPVNITYIQNNTEVVGFFGVVGRIDDDSYSSSVNKMIDVTLDNITVESKTTNTLIGIAAGYVNAEMSGVKVGTSTISVNGNSSKSYTNNLSNYGLVGYTTKTGTNGSFTQKLSNYYDSNSAGDDPGWGGSIDMKAFFTRLDTIRTNYSATSKSLGIVYDDVYDPNNTRISHEVRSGKTYSYSAVYNEDYSKNNVEYDSKIGALKTRYGNLLSGQIYYLGAGHYSVSQTKHLYKHDGIRINAGANYSLNVTNFANNQAVSNAAQDSSVIWNEKSATGGIRLYSTNNNIPYYLQINNTTNLRIVTSEANGTIFVKEQNPNSNNTFRYRNGNYYIGYNNGWKMIALPTVPVPPSVDRPTEVVPEPTEPTLPVPTIRDEPKEPLYPTPPTNIGNQLYYTDGSGNNHFIVPNGTSSISASDAPYVGGWTWSNNKFSTTINNSNYYIAYNVRIGTDNTGTISLTKNDQYNTLTKNENNTYYYTHHGIFGDYIYYLHYNNGSFNIQKNTSDQFSLVQWAQTYKGEYKTKNDADTEYASDLSTYESRHAAWVIDHNKYEEEYAQYLIDKAEYDAAWEQYYEDLDAYNAYVSAVSQWTTYDNEVIAYNNAIAASYCLSLPSTKVEGPDYYMTSRSSGMDYSSDQDVTYLPLAVENNLQAKKTNTGYIMGGDSFTESTTSSQVAGNVRISSGYTIADNLTNYNADDEKFDDNSVWTFDSTGLHTIDDAKEADPKTRTYAKYIESKGHIEKTLSEGSNIYGLHFTNAQINKNNLVTARYAAINGEEYTNYQMPANSIDFNLRDQGYINFFAGTYGNYDNGSGGTSYTVDSFFSLHQIQRSGSTITDINEIEEIYSDGISGHSYIYKFNNGKYSVPYSIDPYNSKRLYVLGTKYAITNTEHGGYSDGIYHQLDDLYTGYSKVFDMSWLKDNTYDDKDGEQYHRDAWHKAFYFEIPTNPGEYALGTVEGKSYGAYLMYLDIAANAANKDKINAYGVSTFKSGVSYPVGIDFDTTDESNVDGGQTLGIIVSAGSTGDASFTVDNENDTITYESDYNTKYAYSTQTVSGVSPPAAADIPPANGTRIIYTNIVSTDNTVWNIITSETLDESGTSTSTPTYISIVHEDEVLTVDDLPESFAINSIRGGLDTIIATFDRLSGKNEFNISAQYSGAEYKVVVVSLDATGITLQVRDIATGYTITVNTTQITTDPQTYPS